MAPLLVLIQDELAAIKGIKIRSKLKPVSGQFLGLPTDGNVTLGNSSSLPENQTHPTLRPFRTCNESFRDWKQSQKGFLKWPML